jgi:hypothetical protein
MYLTVVAMKIGLWGTVMANSSNSFVKNLELPNIARGEDNFYDGLKDQVHWELWDNPAQMYFRIIHGLNTWYRNLHLLCY